jgi:uncharacterized protein YdeI (YjbR/CyaY-like superfamily)
MEIKKDYKTIYFKNQKAWRDWLDKNHSKENGVWIKFFKKNSGTPTVNYKEALDEALCYGWIDGLVNRFDENSYIQKFTPRRARSNWSKVNTENVKRLTKLGSMKPSGIAAVEAAKKDGRWDAAYESPKNAKVPEDFLKVLSKHKKAEEFFKTLNKSNLYAISYQLQTAKKPETRERRLNKILEMMKKGEKLW